MSDIGVGAVCAVIGCIVGLAGWIYSRDRRTASDSEWKGGVNKTLDSILKLSMEMSVGVEKLREKVEAQGERIIACEHKIQNAHERIDEL